MKSAVFILFILMYVLMIVFSEKRIIISSVTAVLFVILDVVHLKDVFSAIDWNVLMMLSGTMGTVAFFSESKMPNRMADKLLQKTPNTMWVAIALSLFAGVISAFVDNVATVLMIAPVSLAIAKKTGISPVPLLISIAVSSNLQGAATLVGDTTSIMLSGYTKMNFMDFIFMDGRPSIFWGVELGAVSTIPVLMFIFADSRDKKVVVDRPVEVKDKVPAFLLLANILALIAASFLPVRPRLINGIICISVFLIASVHSVMRTKSFRSFKDSIFEIDLETIGILASLFIVIRGIENAGIVGDIANWFVKVGNNNLFLMYSIIVWGSVVLSAFIDNIPYVATMLPIVGGISSLMGCNPYILQFGLLTGATLGGNLTPIGASANIAAIGILRKEGYKVKNQDFFRVGIPFTLVAVISGYLFCWLVWSK